MPAADIRNAPLIRISAAGIGNFTIIKVTIKYTFSQIFHIPQHRFYVNINPT